MKHTVTSLALLAGLAHAATGQVIEWTNAAGGNWYDNANWNLTAFPYLSTHTASISLPGSYTVSLDSSNIIGLGSISLTNPDATLMFIPGRILKVLDTVTNDGLIVVEGDYATAESAFFLADGGEISGTGLVRIDGFDQGAVFGAAAGSRFTNAASHTIAGTGEIRGSINNLGLIVADRPEEFLFIVHGPLTNLGRIGTEGGKLWISSPTIDQHPTGDIFADGGEVRFFSNVVNHGTLHTTNGGIIYSENAALDYVTNTGTLHVRTLRHVLIERQLQNDGTILINPEASNGQASLLINGETGLGGQGSIVLNAPGYLAQIGGGGALYNNAPHSIEGIGLVSVPFSNGGRIAPGIEGVGTILAAAPIGFLPTAEYNVDVAGDDHADTIESLSSFHADGLLTVELIDGFEPDTYWEATIVQAASGITGRFSTTDAPTPTDPRLAFRVRYEPDEIRIGFYCTADIDADASLTFFDISSFIAAYNAGDPGADLAEPFGTLNFFDISDYIAAFNAGCP